MKSHVPFKARQRQSAQAVAAAAFAGSLLVSACGGGGDNEPFIPHSYPPPHIIAFQVHYVAPATPGEPPQLSVQPLDDTPDVASAGVGAVKFDLWGREVQLFAQRSTNASTGRPRYDFALPAEYFLSGAYSCHDGLSVVKVTDRFGRDLTQSIELCPGPSVDFPAVYRYVP